MTEELFTIVQIRQKNSLTYLVNEVHLRMFLEPDLVKFTPLHQTNGRR